MRLKFWPFIFFLTSCNSFFYYPDSYLYQDLGTFGHQLRREKIQALNGKKIEVVTLKSATPKYGTVIHFHGNAQNLTAHAEFTAWLVEEGFDLVLFDYQGYGQSEGVPSRENSVNDGLIVLKKTEENAHGHPIFMLGQSLGGAVAYTSAALAKTKPCAIAIEASFPSYRKIARKKLSQFWGTWLLQWPLSFLVTDELSPSLFSSQLNVPAAFFHGEKDRVVPIEEGQAFYNLHKGFKVWESIPNGGHLSAFIMKESPYRKKLVNFFYEASKNCVPISAN